MRRAFALSALGVWFVGCSTADPPRSTLFDDASTPDTSTVDGSILDAGTLDSSTLDAPPPDSSSCTLVIAPSNPTCASCLQASCCGATNACLPTPDCAALDACMTKCTGDAGADSGKDPNPKACWQACFLAYPNVVNPWSTYDNCKKKSCPSQCP